VLQQASSLPEPVSPESGYASVTINHHAPEGSPWELSTDPPRSRQNSTTQIQDGNQSSCQRLHRASSSAPEGTNAMSHTDPIELPTTVRNSSPPISLDPEPGHHIWSWFCHLQWKPPLKDGWFWIMVLALIAAVVEPITVHFIHTIKPPKLLVITKPIFGEVPPVPDSYIGAAVSLFSVSFSEHSFGEPEIRVAYNSEGGKICVLTKTNSSWDSRVECIEGLNTKPNTPLTLLDRIGGPSIYFITADNRLSGIDSVCHPQSTNCGVTTWKRSFLASSGIRVHSFSQLNSVTWEFGASSRLYYQSPDGQLQEYGIDDFRDLTWRNGSTGPLGDCQGGTGIGTSRWLNGTKEVFEVFVQVNSNAICGRRFIKGAWDLNPYTVVEPPDEASRGASITATTVNDGAESMVLMAYIAPNSYLKAQTRRNANMSLSLSDFSNFSTPVQIVQGDGLAKSGLAAVSWPGAAKIFFVDDKKILELSSDNSTGVVGANWTTTEVGSG
jgi:hypothetical protein